ncbi:hypothetical protein KQH65_08880 [archaeon]|nr:hypothetical protein [archaeon]
MYRKKLTLILTAILATSITIPMIRAPARQPERFGDPIGNLIADKDDPTLIGPAASLIAAIDNVENVERQLDFDPDVKSLSDLSPKDQARLLRAVNRANGLAHKFKVEAGLLEKSINPIEINALNYINGAIPVL